MIAALCEDKGVPGGEVPFQEVVAVAPARLPVVRFQDAEHVRILLRAFLRAGKDEVILRRSHLDAALFREVPREDGALPAHRVDAEKGVPLVQEKGLRPGHPAHADRIKPDQLLPAWEALHDAVMLRFRAVGDGEMLNDVIGFVRKTYTCDALPVQEVVQSDRPLGQKGRAHKKGGRKKKDSSHNQFVLAADAGGKSEGTEKVQRGLLFIFGRRCK